MTAVASVLGVALAVAIAAALHYRREMTEAREVAEMWLVEASAWEDRARRIECDLDALTIEHEPGPNGAGNGSSTLLN